MVRFRHAFPALLCLFLAPGARADEFQRIDYRYTAARPVVILEGWSCWYPNCRFASCNMNTEVRPRLGTLKVQVRPVTIPAGNACAGHATRGLFITYTPRPGAQGQDEIVMRSIADNGGRHVLHFSVLVPGRQ